MGLAWYGVAWCVRVCLLSVSESVSVCVNQVLYLKGVGALGDGLLSLLLLGLSLGLVGSGGVQGKILDLLLDFSHGNVSR